jgi:hypothetical protein
MMLKEGGEMNAQTRIAIIAASIFLLIAPFSAMAQNPPDLEVSDPLWVYDVNVRFSVNAFNSGIIGAQGGFNSPYVVNEVSALFRNTGTKTAKSVTWEFVVRTYAVGRRINNLREVVISLSPYFATVALSTE